MKKVKQISLSVLITCIIILTLIELAVVIFGDNYVFEIIVIGLINLLIIGLAIFQNHGYILRRSSLIHLINEASDDSLNTALAQLPMGLIRFEAGTREPEWYNHYVELVFSKLPDKLTVEELLQLAYSKKPLEISDRKYSVELDGKRNLLYLVDNTAELESKHTLIDRRPVIGTISVDNYADIADALSERERSTLNSFIIDFLDTFASENQIYLRRLSGDRYILFTNFSTLSTLMNSKFDFLDSFREQSIENKTPLALSIGISYGVNDFAAIGQTALNNLDLALVRGGDQVVLKENTDQARAVYFGGNSETHVEKSRTRARAISTSLKTIVSESDKVFIMGHQYTDMDSLGAAIAMKNFATMNGKEAFVVYRPDQLLPDVERAINKLNSEDEDLYNHIVYLETAKKQKTSNSLLIMVDHSKISQTMDVDFYKSFSKVVLIDHHRRDEDFPTNIMLSYIESGASSASEMAVEILQFQDSSQQKMTAIEASVALAGISVDTKSFTKATTSKTFEAASYLRIQGADNEMIQYFLATDFSEFKKVNEIVLSAEFVDQSIAIALGKEGITYDNVTVAKAADKLVTMNGIQVSFAIAQHDESDAVIVSARSRGTFNVQTLMEMMGGGGHFDTAATQIQEKTILEVKGQLLELLKEREDK